MKLDDGETIKSVLQGYNEVTPERVQEVANKYLPDKNGNYVLYIGDPLKKS